jgi:hypothetical protein
VSEYRLRNNASLSNKDPSPHANDAPLHHSLCCRPTAVNVLCCSFTSRPTCFCTFASLHTKLPKLPIPPSRTNGLGSRLYVEIAWSVTPVVTWPRARTIAKSPTNSTILWQTTAHDAFPRHSTVGAVAGRVLSAVLKPQLCSSRCLRPHLDGRRD